MLHDRCRSSPVGTGHDSFVFQQIAPGSIGAVTINHFNPSKDVIVVSNQFATSVSVQDNSQGNAVITVDNAGDTITLVGVHSSRSGDKELNIRLSEIDCCIERLRRYPGREAAQLFDIRPNRIDPADDSTARDDW